eukprot:TRINITY_DN744_c0_g1_i2.p2 TRINITY_DN744_c0_g1~~TRINITY_DN744_c0_g1_i2.p2  ORF type:complete len:151 (+),score=31.48 TRINITY_DN744_c0_g1_i2:464-916(+)
MQLLGIDMTKITSALSGGSFMAGNLRFARYIVLAGTVGLLAGCQTGQVMNQNVLSIDAAQGSEQNIASLTNVIASNPNDPGAYNVRGAAYGRAGEDRKAIEDFNQAIALNPNYYQAYANRALIERSLGRQMDALNDYNRALQTSTPVANP